jgi:hypothetical protein
MNPAMQVTFGIDFSHLIQNTLDKGIVKFVGEKGKEWALLKTLARLSSVVRRPGLAKANFFSFNLIVIVLSLAPTALCTRKSTILP